MTTPANPRPNPYVGPRPFRPGERLYGRDREIDGLLNVLIAERVVLLYSPSGAGKSSLVQAGLLPYLHNDGGFGLLPIARVNLEPDPPLTLIPGFNRYTYSVLCAWEEARPEAERLPPLALAGLTLNDYLNDHVHLEQPATLLVIDQFEEVLTVDPMNAADKAEFFEQLGRALRDKTRWALFSMREDFIAGLDPYLRPIPTRFSNRFRLDLLALEAAVQAVRLPAEDNGVTFQEEAARRLVDDLRRIRVQKPTGESEEQLGPYVEPVQLQVVCRRLWDGLAPGDQYIDSADVEAAGSADQALSDYYADRVRAVAEQTEVSERLIRAWFDQQLITENGIRGQVLLGPEKSQGLDNRAVRALERAHLVRSEKRGGAIWFELAHDRLIKPVRQNNQAWFEAHLSPFQRAAEMWHRANRPDYLLLSGRFLFEGMKWATPRLPELNEVEKDFWAACAKAEARARRDRIVRGALIGLALFVALLAVLVGMLYVQAENQRGLALARGLAAASLNNLTADPELSVLLALQAADYSTEAPEVQDALHRALNAQRIILRLSHTGPVYAARFTTDNLGILTAGEEGILRRWDLEGQVVWATRPEDSHTGTIYTLIPYPDGEYVATGGRDGRVKLWRADTGQLVRTLFTLPDARIWWLSLDTAGARLGVAASNTKAYILDPFTGAVQLTLSGHTKDVSGVAFSDMGFLATASYDRRIFFWSDSGEPLMVYAPTLAADDLDPALVMEANGRAYTVRPSINHAADVQSVAFDPHRPGVLYSTGSDRSVRLWNVFPSLEVPNAVEVMLLENNTTHTDWVYNLALGSGLAEDVIATFSEDRTIRLWRTDGFSLREALTLYGNKGGVFSGGFTSDGFFLVSAARDGEALVWATGPSQELFTQNAGERVYAAAFSPDGKRIVTGQRQDNGAQASVWDAEKGVLLFDLGPHFDAVEAAAYSPDGRYILTGSRDGYARLWQAEDGALVRQAFHPAALCTPFNATDCYIYGVAWAPDGARFATAGRDGRVVVWDAATMASTLVLDARLGSAASVAFSPDGQWLASGHASGYAVLWDAQVGQRLFTVERFSLHDLSQLALTERARLNTLEAQSDVVEAVAFSPRGHRLVTASADGTAYVWDVTDPAQPRFLDELYGHVGGIYTAAYDPSGRYILTGSTDKTVKVWDAETLDNRLTLLGHTDRVYAAAMNAAGTRLLSAGADGLLRLYSMDTAELIDLARQRVTRTLTDRECRKYLPTPVCPTP